MHLGPDYITPDEPSVAVSDRSSTPHAFLYFYCGRNVKTPTRSRLANAYGCHPEHVHFAANYLFSKTLSDLLIAGLVVTRGLGPCLTAATYFHRFYMRRMLEDYNELVGAVLTSRHKRIIHQYIHQGDWCYLSLSCFQNRGEWETTRGRCDRNVGKGSWDRSR
jgi:hypothetical protein